MKKLLKIAMAGLLLLPAHSCEKVDVVGVSPEEPPLPLPIPDTALYVSAVKVPPDYDWRRDSAAGGAGCELILYRNMKPVAVYPTGADACISTDPDTHHIIDGRLYTEFATDSQTIIKRDGEEVLRYPGREFLVGLLPSGNSIYTLGRLRSGGGYKLRKNRTLILEMEDCCVFGSFNASSYGTTGALYIDGGHSYFCYREPDGRCFKVRDGVPYPVKVPSSASEVYDVKVHDGKEYLFYGSGLGTSHVKTPSKTIGLGNYSWVAAGMCFDQGDICIMGFRIPHKILNVVFGGEPESVCQILGGEVKKFSSGADFIYCREKEIYAVCSRAGGLIVDDGDGPLLDIPLAYCFSRDCAVITDAGLCVGVTPRGGGRPYVILEGEDYPLDINGFISSLGFCIKH